MSKILVTGGLGFIGSHFIANLKTTKKVIIIDNLSNSNMSVLDKIKKLTNTKILFYEVDLRNYDNLENIFKKNKISDVFHFASLKSVEQSIVNSKHYYNNNVIGSKNLIDLCHANKVKNFTFSSSATVYGIPKYLPINEEHSLNPVTPYGENKVEIEKLLEIFSRANSSNSVKVLRYFNPIGAHSSKILGEFIYSIPTNIMPYILGVASGKYDYLKIYGNDYETFDGTCIRDFIHVEDLVDAHIRCLHMNRPGFYVINIGTGKGHSILELVNKFSNVNKIKLPYKFYDRRKGDVPVIYTSCQNAEKILNWRAKRSLIDMCKDSYNFQLQNY